MTLVGVPEYIAYSLLHPGASAFELSCQGSESAIGFAKSFSSECGTGKSNMPQLVADWMDLSGVGMLINDQVDFEAIIKRLKLSELLIFDPRTTPLLENSLESKMAPIMLHIVHLLENWEVGDPIPVFLAQILNALTLDVQSLDCDKLQRILENSYTSTVNSEIQDIETQQLMAQMQAQYESHISMRQKLVFEHAVVNERI